MGASEATLSSISMASTYEEIGEFWDTHSFVDYLDQSHEVEYENRLPRKVALAESVFEALQHEAARQRVSPETLVNLWVAEKLHERAKRTEVPVTPVSAPAQEVKAESVPVLAEEKASYETQSGKE